MLRCVFPEATMVHCQLTVSVEGGEASSQFWLFTTDNSKNRNIILEIFWSHFRVVVAKRFNKYKEISS